MRRALGLGAFCVAAFLLGACNGHTGRAGHVPEAAEPRYRTSIELGQPLLVRPHRLPQASGSGGHACLQGRYTHVYRTDSGWHGQPEVWLCCVPIEELLSDSFDCAASPFPPLFSGGEGYLKVRFCTLLDPTSTVPRYIPVCVPAPLQAPDVE